MQELEVVGLELVEVDLEDDQYFVVEVADADSAVEGVAFDAGGAQFGTARAARAGGVAGGAVYCLALHVAVQRPALVRHVAHLAADAQARTHANCAVGAAGLAVAAGGEGGAVGAGQAL